MAYFAEIDDTGLVRRVLVVEQPYIDSGKLGDPTRWIETKPDGSSRKNYAGIGYKFDAARNAFTPPQPFPSWTLNEQTARYDPPRQMPRDDILRVWSERDQDWVRP